MIEFSHTFCAGHGMLWECARLTVRAVKAGCYVSLARSWRACSVRKRERWVVFLTECDALRRVMAGVRMDGRMPSWMTADVLRELGAPEVMCELVMRSDLDMLGTGFSDGGTLLTWQG